MIIMKRLYAAMIIAGLVAGTALPVSALAVEESPSESVTEEKEMESPASAEETAEADTAYDHQTQTQADDETGPADSSTKTAAEKDDKQDGTKTGDDISSREKNDENPGTGKTDIDSDTNTEDKEDGPEKDTDEDDTDSDEKNMDGTNDTSGQNQEDGNSEKGEDGENTDDAETMKAEGGDEDSTADVKDNVRSTTSPVWADIPHTAIEYNTWDKYTDSYGAVYSDNGKAKFDIYSEMPAHLGEAGGEFTSGITVKFNDNYSTAFYPRFITVDADGNVNWDPKLTNLEKGTYKLYIASTDAWHKSSNIKELNDMDQIYGEATMTIGEDRSDGETRDTMRWSLDLDKVGKKLGMSGDELGEISVQYSRLGQQWATCAGTPTGSKGLFGLLSLLALVPAGIIRKRGINA